MAKVKGGFMSVLLWIVGVLVSLAVGFGMVDGVLSVPYIPIVVMQIAGWVVVLGTLLGVIMALVKALSK